MNYSRYSIEAISFEVLAYHFGVISHKKRNSAGRQPELTLEKLQSWANFVKEFSLDLEHLYKIFPSYEYIKGPRLTAFTTEVSRERFTIINLYFLKYQQYLLTHPEKLRVVYQQRVGDNITELPLVTEQYPHYCTLFGFSIDSVFGWRSFKSFNILIEQLEAGYKLGDNNRKLSSELYLKSLFKFVTLTPITIQIIQEYETFIQERNFYNNYIDAASIKEYFSEYSEKYLEFEPTIDSSKLF